MKIILPNGVMLFIPDCRKYDIEKGVLNLYTVRERRLAHFVIAHIAGFYFDNECVEVIYPPSLRAETAVRPATDPGMREETA